MIVRYPDVVIARFPVKLILAIIVGTTPCACTTEDQRVTRPTLSEQTSPRSVDQLADLLVKSFQYFAITGTKPPHEDTIRKLLIVASTPDLNDIELAVVKAVKRADVDPGSNWRPAMDLLKEMLIAPAAGKPKWRIFTELNGFLYMPTGYGFNGPATGLESFIETLHELRRMGNRRDLTEQLLSYGLMQRSV